MDQRDEEIMNEVVKAKARGMSSEDIRMLVETSVKLAPLLGYQSKKDAILAFFIGANLPMTPMMPDVAIALKPEHLQIRSNLCPKRN